MMRRAGYIAYRVIEMLIGILSRFINAALLGGSTHQTVSARAHIEDGIGWQRTRATLNVIFWWHDDHCEWAWEQEVYHAIRTLDINEMNLTLAKD